MNEDMIATLVAAMSRARAPAIARAPIEQTLRAAIAIACTCIKTLKISLQHDLFNTSKELYARLTFLHMYMGNTFK